MRRLEKMMGSNPPNESGFILAISQRKNWANSSSNGFIMMSIISFSPNIVRTIISKQNKHYTTYILKTTAVSLITDISIFQINCYKFLEYFIYSKHSLLNCDCNHRLSKQNWFFLLQQMQHRKRRNSALYARNFTSHTKLTKFLCKHHFIM